jgi:nucleotide-binding universal stress UspA family protein
MNLALVQPIRSMLVHLDGTDAGATRLAVARRLAQQRDATLCALFVASPPDWPMQLALSESPAALLQTTDWAALERAKSAFDDMPTQPGERPRRWIDGSGTDAVALFREQALYADLLVLGQPDLAQAGVGAPAGFAASVLIHTGKPALVVPLAMSPARAVGRQVLIGWNGSPESAHAVAAALPWLHAAKHVHVLDATEASRESGTGGLDILQHLAWHGVEPELHAGGHDGADAGRDLLSLAAEVGADLLVMGCYGHSRTREIMLGGASQTVLREMTLPVLMAH